MRIERVHEANFEAALALIAQYQTWYGKTPDSDRNRSHFGRFWHTDQDMKKRAYTRDDPPTGLQFLLLDNIGGAEQAIGFATLYFPFSSLRARSYCLMNDLFVAPGLRSKGYGRALVLHCLKEAHGLGFEGISWTTAQSNTQAQRLYDSLGGEKSAWFEYDLDRAK